MFKKRRIATVATRVRNANLSIVLIVLVLTANGVHAESVEHTYSTDGVIFVDPLLTGLTSVSGSFTYDRERIRVSRPRTAGLRVSYDF